MIARDSTSYPYLAVAQHWKMSYGLVLAFTDQLDRLDGDAVLNHRHGDTWVADTVLAWRRERTRRATA